MALLSAVLGLTLALVALLVTPLLRAAEPEDRRRFDLEVYKDQLAELDRDLGRGLIGEPEAAAARLEIQRRILAAAETAGGVKAGPSAARRRPALALALLGTLSVFAGGLYWARGRPDLPDQPLAGRPAPAPAVAAADGAPEIDGLVDALRARLEASPNDPQGWLLLGRSEMSRGDGAAAVAAYRRVTALAPDAVEPKIELGEALVLAADGVVTPEAKRLFAEAADDPRAAYYRGLGQAQAGELRPALATWRGLLARAPADAPWRGRVEESVRLAARDLGVDPGPMPRPAPATAPPPTGGPGPSAADVARMRAMAPEDRAQMIGGMVDGLEARLRERPDDVAGWLRLARARGVLGQPARAEAALGRALDLRPDDPELVRAVVLTRLGAGRETGAPPRVDGPTADLLRRWTRLAPAAPEPFWYLGLHAFQSGRKDEAARDWRAALERMPRDHPDRPALAARLAALDAAP